MDKLKLLRSVVIAGSICVLLTLGVARMKPGAPGPSALSLESGIATVVADPDAIPISGEIEFSLELNTTLTTRSAPASTEPDGSTSEGFDYTDFDRIEVKEVLHHSFKGSFGVDDEDSERNPSRVQLQLLRGSKVLWQQSVHLLATWHSEPTAGELTASVSTPYIIFDQVRVLVDNLEAYRRAVQLASCNRNGSCDVKLFEDALSCPSDCNEKHLDGVSVLAVGSTTHCDPDDGTFFGGGRGCSQQPEILCSNGLADLLEYGVDCGWECEVKDCVYDDKMRAALHAQHAAGRLSSSRLNSLLSQNFTVTTAGEAR